MKYPTVLKAVQGLSLQPNSTKNLFSPAPKSANFTTQSAISGGRSFMKTTDWPMEKNSPLFKMPFSKTAIE